MQVQQNVTVYESFGTSTVPSRAESPVSQERELEEKQHCDRPRESEESLSFPAACHLVVSHCLFLLLGIRPAWVEPSEIENSEVEIYEARYSVMKSMFNWCRFSVSCLLSNSFVSLSGNQRQSSLYLRMPTNRYVLWYNRIGPFTTLLFLI